MLADSTSKDPMDDYLNKISDLIDEHGWAVQWVGGDPTQVSFAYTVGLFTRGLPEILIFGLPDDVAQPILNDLAARATSGAGFTDGLVLRDVVAGFPVVLVEVIDSSAYLTVANALARTVSGDRQVRAWQVVFPDAVGRWPWDTGSRVAATPMLGAVPCLARQEPDA